MKTLTTVIIGAGQTGLAMSRELMMHDIDHVVLERGQIANSWRKERWDGLRLLTPNWLNGLPGQPYRGDDIDGFMPVSELIREFDKMVASADLPILTDSPVRSVRMENGQYRVETSQDVILCKSLVVATGACARVNRPDFASELPPNIVEVSPLTYRRPTDLPDGGVLVVGASASGVQLARDIQKSGWQVTLATGSHTRVPRRYRGVDIMTWMHLLGHLGKAYDEVDNIDRVRRLPSFQLCGEPSTQDLDLNALQDAGIEIVGRLAGISNGRAMFSGSLNNLCASADLKMDRLLGAIDSWVDQSGLTQLVEPPHRFSSTRVSSTPRLSLDLEANDIRSIVWATGYEPDHRFLQLPIFDAKGRIRHQGGVVAPGLYVMGLMFLRRLSSSFINGAGDDARDLAAHLRGCLDGQIEIAA
ncbi:MAG: NAD(P)-binding domain-containing protein [Pseudomonadota bacterium]